MFQQRQLNDVYQLVETGFTSSGNPGTVSAGNVQHLTLSVYTGANADTADPAQVTLGDQVDIIATLGTASVAGLIVQATPVAAGSVEIMFYNTTGSPIVPGIVSYIILSKRLTPTVL
jgi:hypothetical protein